MNRWRTGLLIAVTTGSVGGWLWMLTSEDAGVNSGLALTAVAFVVGTGGVLWHYRAKLTRNLFTSNLALGSLVHLLFAALVVGGDRLWELGLFPALRTNGGSFAIGVLGIVAAFVTWTRARGRIEPAVVPVLAEPEPAPETPVLDRPVDWELLRVQVTEPAHRRQLQTLERIAAALDGNAGPGAARRIVHQEALRLVSAAGAAELEDDDLLSQAAAFLEWGAQKLPELAEIDASDLLMGKAIGDIRALSTEVVHRFVDHRRLLPIHPIDRETASAKCDERAEAFQAALPVIEANGMRLSEDLIAAESALAAFRSVTGFQVVALGERGFVTFEGNGRREALQRAFGDETPVFVEVREYRFGDLVTRETIERRIERVRRWKGVAGEFER